MIYIQRIIRKMKQGQTGPYLCVGEDGKQYIVKGPNTTYAGLVHEWVCGKLAQAIGLPIPDFDTAYVDRTLLEYGSYELEEGEWFASKYEENIQDVPFKLLEKLDSEQLKLLFIFDYWIKNGDRNLTAIGGNPNLFIRSDLSSFVVLDHNLSFDLDYDDSFVKLKISHIGSSAWFSKQLTLFDQSHYRGLLTSCFQQLESIFSSVPEEWVENCSDNGILEHIRVVLARYENEAFWEGIK